MARTVSAGAVAAYPGRAILTQIKRSPEAVLLAAVIDLAVRDLCQPDDTGQRSAGGQWRRSAADSNRDSARRYFTGPQFITHCELLGLDSEWVLGMVRTAERETRRLHEAAAAAQGGEW